MSVRLDRSLLRWLVPLAVVAAVGSGVAVAAGLNAGSDTPLPGRSPAQLIADIRGTTLQGFSGTLRETADLGLPDNLTDAAGGDGDAAFASLVAGTHTLRTWYAGPRLSRVALLGALGESDLIRSGRDLWIWSSADLSTTHVTLPAVPVRAGPPSPLPTGLPTTPQEAASALLAALNPSTSVTVGSNVTVAGRRAYTLIVSPREPGSLIAQVRIAVDGSTHLPLRVQMYAHGVAKPAFELAFTQISFETPDPAMFKFNPLPGGSWTNYDLSSGGGAGLPEGASRSVVIGSGWTAVLAVRLPVDRGTTPDQLPRVLPFGIGSVIKTMADRLPPTRTAFGTGHLITGRLFSAMVTDDGRVLVGAVDGTQLLRAANNAAAALAGPQPPAHK